MNDAYERGMAALPRERIAELEQAITEDLTSNGHMEGCRSTFWQNGKPCDCAARALRKNAEWEETR